MIFKRLFQPKFQHTDPAVRKAAAEKLDPKRAQDKAALHELAFNDSDTGVMMAALTRLNSFALWCKVAETTHVKRLQQAARKHIKDALELQGSIIISQQERLAFIRECRSNPLLEMILQQQWLHQCDHEHVLMVLDKLNKAYWYDYFLLNSDDPALQKALIARTNDTKLLNKLVKRSSDQVKQAAKQRYDELVDQQRQQEQLLEQSRILLSRLLALLSQSEGASDRQQVGQVQQDLDKIFATMAQLHMPELKALRNKRQQIEAKSGHHQIEQG